MKFGMVPESNRAGSGSSSRLDRHLMSMSWLLPKGSKGSGSLSSLFTFDVEVDVLISVIGPAPLRLVLSKKRDELDDESVGSGDSLVIVELASVENSLE